VLLVEPLAVGPAEDHLHLVWQAFELVGHTREFEVTAEFAGKMSTIPPIFRCELIGAAASKYFPRRLVYSVSIADHLWTKLGFALGFQGQLNVARMLGL